MEYLLQYTFKQGNLFSIFNPPGGEDMGYGALGKGYDERKKRKRGEKKGKKGRKGKKKPKGEEKGRKKGEKKGLS